MSEPADPRYDGSEIAVVGMSGRFPGAPELEAFWRNLAEGVESIRRFTDAELRPVIEDPKVLDDPHYVRARSILEGVDLFDADFFGFTPQEAEVLDPQLRLFLECAFAALEHAGHDPERLPGRASLFAGASFSNYLVKNLYKNRPVMEAFGDFQATVYNVQDALVTMVGYKLNLKGACCAVQTFCSTSLVGVHLACQNLLNYESDLALAGGVTVFVPQTSGYLFEEGSILSREGRCRVFDARADGTVFGNGVGAVVLRRLEDARMDGDTIHAVIRGSAVNNDGSLKVSFAAPGVVGQTEVVVEALSAAGVDPESIGYVEAHGTGTRLGDPAELSALTRAFRTKTDRVGFCAIGSVKTNVGHLDAAAGVAGLIKVILSLQHRQIPASLHFETPNPAIDFATSPFFVNTTLRDWPRTNAPRRAGISAFGVGGTNAHLIVEEAPSSRSETSLRREQLLVLSAKSETALDAAARRLADHLRAHPDLPLADVAWTLQQGRGAFAHRRTAVCGTSAEAVTLLEGAGLPTTLTERRNPPVVLLLRDQAVSSDAWADLLEQEPLFRDTLQSSRGIAGGAEAGPLATLGIQYALGRLLQSWGVRFERVLGEGVGTLAAACLEGRLDLADAVARVRRGELGAPGSSDGLGALAADSSRLRLDVGGEGVALRRADGSIPNAAGALVASATRGSLLQVLGHLWRHGVDVDWQGLHAPERRRRVPLPTYPFERRRFWVEPVEEEKAAERNPAEWLYRPVWKTAMPAPAGVAPQSGRYLVFLDSCGLGKRLTERLRAAGSEVITVAAGSAFTGHPVAGYTLAAGEARHYARLFEDLEKQEKRPDRVLHLFSLDPLDAVPPGAARFERASDLGFYSLLHLAAARSEGALAVMVVSSGLHDVDGGDSPAPEKAPLVPLCRVLGQEQHDLRCSVVDVEPPAGAVEALVDPLLAELALEPGEPVVAYRRGRRWVQDYDRIPVAGSSSSGSPLRSGGVYLITGGLGDVGFVLGVALAKEARAKLVLTGRRELPPRDRWAEWLSTHEAGEETAIRIRKVQALETFGAEVLVQPADAASSEQMHAAVRAARDRFGALHGVIHAAGELSLDTFRSVRDMGREACERQFTPKVYGLYALQEALSSEPLDFVMLTSSLSSVLGGIGYSAYAGANAFMDAFAGRERSEGKPWLAVAWDQWELGPRSSSGTARLAARDGNALKPTEGIALFDRILRLRGLDRVVVSTAPLESRLERWVRLSSSPDVPSVDGARPRPALATSYEAPRNESERVLAGIWQELLGLERIGVDDNFFELGGHSLFAARVLSRVRASLGVSLPLEDVFDHPTVAGLAARAEAARRGRGTGVPTGDRVEIEI